MTSYTVYMDQLPGLLELWAREFQVHVPVEVEEGIYDFVPWRKDEEIAWEYDVAYNTLKRFFLPPRETLLRFDPAACTAEVVCEAPKQLLFGVHPYDVKAANQLDTLMRKDVPDNNFISRKKNTVIFALEPAAVARNAFWASIDAHKVDNGYDLYWTRISSASFHVEVATRRGKELLLAGGPLDLATDADKEAARHAHQRIIKESLRNGLKYPWRETADILSRAWDSTLWQHRARHCFSCGTCNLVCPTCYCFDMKEELDNTLTKGERYREWDGCMMDSFSRVAGDHNFRPHTRERFRHRYYRKGKYIYDKIGQLGCVGCGRCVSGCTSGIADPKAVFNELWEADRHDS